MKHLFFILLIFSLLTHCDKEKEEEGICPDIPMPPENILARDVANFGDGRDLSVAFSKPSDREAISAFKIFIVKENKAAAFDSTTASTTPHFVQLQASDNSQYNFDELAMDTEAELVTEGVNYQLFAASISKENAGLALSAPSATIRLEQKNVVRTLTSSLNEGSGGMDVDAQGNIYMADFGGTTGGNPWGDRILKITPDGQVTTFVTGLTGASGNDFDQEGNLFQSNIAAGAISKITPEGTLTEFASGFSAPVGITIDSSGHLFVCNCSANSISKVTPQGEVSLFVQSNLMNCPNGIDMDQKGNLYVASFNSRNLVKITPEGSVSTFASLPGNNNGHLLIRGEWIYVVSRGLHQIHRVSFDGQVSWLAGNGQRGIVDGPLSEASFSLPNDLAFSPDGRYIYINDVNGSNPNPTVISPTIIRVIELVE